MGGLHVRQPVRCQIGGEKKRCALLMHAIPTMNAHSPPERACANFSPLLMGDGKDGGEDALGDLGRV